jgi:hypothetical protein
MKNALLPLIICALAFSPCHAQDENQYKETFDKNTFKWDEMGDKKSSVQILDGYLVIQNKNSGPVTTITRYPVKVDRPFKITSKFLIQKLDSKSCFGIIYNRSLSDNDEVEEFSYFVIKGSECIWGTCKDGKYMGDKPEKIKLKEGKDQIVIVTMENKGKKLVFSVNNMTALEIQMDLKYPFFGFYSEGKSTVKIDEVIIDQFRSEDE